MEVVVRVALMFFFIQFVVVMTIMSVALLLARPEVPTLGRQIGRAARICSLGFIVRLSGRVHASIIRLAHSTPPSLRGVRR